MLTLFVFYVYDLGVSVHRYGKERLLMISPVEDAAKKLRDFLTTSAIDKEKMNEAETRLLIIDEILGILGWSKYEYNPELPTSEPSGYTDYRLSVDGQPRLIVEAKRRGLLQPLSKPIRHPQYENSFLYNNCGSEMKSLLEQCRKYCASCGLLHAVATTGDIWIILLTFKRGVEWGDLKALVFHSLEDVLARFSDFYGLISREAVRNNSLEEKFGSMFIAKPPSAIRPGEGIIHHSNIEQVSYKQTISAFFDYFMADITRSSQKDMLEHCYVSNAEINDFSHDLQQILRYDATLEHAEVESQEVSALKTSSEALESQAFSGSPRTILLIGNIGAGKSTFIHKFVREEMENNQKRPEQRLCVLVDLIDEKKTISSDQGDEQHVAELVLDGLIKLLKEKSQFEDKLDPYSFTVQRVCFEDMLARFRKRKPLLYQEDRKQYDIESEAYLYQLCEEKKYDYLVRYIQYLRKKRYKIWIAFDNVDRGSYSYQQFIYDFAHRLAKGAYCVTLLTLRQDTFQEAQEAGFLDVRRTDTVFQLHAPEFRQVVAKRRRYIDRVIETNEIPKQFKENLQLVTLLNEHLKHLVLQQEASIRLLITTFSMNNVRYALAMLTTYYTSPHSTFHEFYQHSCDNAPSTLTTQFNYEVEQTRFLQSLMLRSKWNYEEKRSDIFNLFSVDPFEEVSHFLMLRILAYLSLKLNSVTSKYSIKYANIYNDFIFLGYQGRHVNNATLRLKSAGLLISPNLTTEAETLDPLPQETKLILSPKGYYYLLHLVSQPYYQTRVGEDTIWYNEQLAKDYIACLEETGNAQKPGTDDALQATEARNIFVKYLRLSLLEEVQDSSIHHTSKEWAQLMNRLVEEKVFGMAITTYDRAASSENATVKKDQHSGNEKLREYEKEIADFYDNYDKYFIEPQKKREKDNSRQMSLFEDELFGYESTIYDDVSLRDAVASLGPLSKGPKTSERSYALIVLWCLEVAFRTGLGPLTSKKIAEIANVYGRNRVATSRISSFLRQQKYNDGEFKHLWDEEPLGYYVINSFGRIFLDGEIGEKEQ